MGRDAGTATARLRMRSRCVALVLALCVAVAVPGDSLGAGEQAGSNVTAPSPPLGAGVVLDEESVPVEVEHEGEVDPSKQHRTNFASNAAGAVIMGANPEMTGVSSLLGDDADSYALSRCGVKKFVIIGLSEDVMADSLILSNEEKYSSTIKGFRVLGAQKFPAAEWVVLGNFSAENRLGEQAFPVTVRSWVRFLKINWLSHYGNEFYCTWTRVKVHGSTILEDLQQQVFTSEAEVHAARQQLQLEAAQRAAGSAPPPTHPSAPPPAHASAALALAAPVQASALDAPHASTAVSDTPLAGEAPPPGHSGLANGPPAGETPSPAQTAASGGDAAPLTEGGVSLPAREAAPHAEHGAVDGGASSSHAGAGAATTLSPLPSDTAPGSRPGREARPAAVSPVPSPGLLSAAPPVPVVSATPTPSPAPADTAAPHTAAQAVAGMLDALTKRAAAHGEASHEQDFATLTALAAGLEAHASQLETAAAAVLVAAMPASPPPTAVSESRAESREEEELGKVGATEAQAAGASAVSSVPATIVALPASVESADTGALPGVTTSPTGAGASLTGTAPQSEGGMAAHPTEAESQPHPASGVVVTPSSTVVDEVLAHSSGGGEASVPISRAPDGMTGAGTRVDSSAPADVGRASRGEDSSIVEGAAEDALEALAAAVGAMASTLPSALPPLPPHLPLLPADGEGAAAPAVQDTVDDEVQALAALSGVFVPRLSGETAAANRGPPPSLHTANVFKTLTRKIADLEIDNTLIHGYLTDMHSRFTGAVVALSRSSSALRAGVGTLKEDVSTLLSAHGGASAAPVQPAGHHPGGACKEGVEAAKNIAVLEASVARVERALASVTRVLMRQMREGGVEVALGAGGVLLRLDDAGEAGAAGLHMEGDVSTAKALVQASVVRQGSTATAPAGVAVPGLPALPRPDDSACPLAATLTSAAGGTCAQSCSADESTRGGALAAPPSPTTLWYGSGWRAGRTRVSSRDGGAGRDAQRSASGPGGGQAAAGDVDGGRVLMAQLAEMQAQLARANTAAERATYVATLTAACCACTLSLVLVILCVSRRAGRATTSHPGDRTLPLSSPVTPSGAQLATHTVGARERDGGVLEDVRTRILPGTPPAGASRRVAAPPPPGWNADAAPRPATLPPARPRPASHDDVQHAAGAGVLPSGADVLGSPVEGGPAARGGVGGRPLLPSPSPSRPSNSLLAFKTTPEGHSTSTGTTGSAGLSPSSVSTQGTEDER